MIVMIIISPVLSMILMINPVNIVVIIMKIMNIVPSIVIILILMVVIYFIISASISWLVVIINFLKSAQTTPNPPINLATARPGIQALGRARRRRGVID